MKKVTLDSGHTVNIEDQYTMDYNNKQLGIPDGSHLKVANITSVPNGTSIVFDVTFPGGVEPMNHFNDDYTQIMAFAMSNLLEDARGMSPK